MKDSSLSLILSVRLIGTGI